MFLQNGRRATLTKMTPENAIMVILVVFAFYAWPEWPT